MKLKKIMTIFIFCFIGALIGNFGFQYLKYGIPVNKDFNKEDNISSILIKIDNREIKLNDKNQINEFKILSNLIYRKINKTQKFVPKMEINIIFDNNEKFNFAINDKAILIDGKYYKANEKHLKIFIKSAQNIYR